MSRRLRVTLSGRVQGVGFRPFVYRLACEGGLSGSTRNTLQGLEIDIQGAPEALDLFLSRLESGAPPGARIDRLDSRSLEPRSGVCGGFVIDDTGGGGPADPDGVDRAPCADCLAELFDRANRRWRHPFITCPACGPRYTIETSRPWARSGTTMADFPLCDACRQEFDSPLDRRFHSETSACPACGPRYALERSASGAPPAVSFHSDPDEVRDPFAAACEILEQGGVVAFQGAGGFHLLCDARNANAVRRVRDLKARDARPFALMVLNTASARSLILAGPDTGALLDSPQRPIVLAPCRADAVLSEEVAPDSGDLGVMLPPTPAHYLLFHDALCRRTGAHPAGTAWLEDTLDLALVCTSANRHNEPILTDVEDVRATFGAGLDGIVFHDRAIASRADDSVLRQGSASVGQAGAPVMIRRARGYVWDPIPLASGGPAVLALGGWLKATQCLVSGNRAFVSRHLGTLATPAAVIEAGASARFLGQRFARRPEALACDLHEDYPSTRLARDLGEEWGLPVIAVQHHHAHIAAVAAENGHEGALFGLALDGSGLGTDGTLWGGELLEVHPDGSFRRCGSLAPLPLPGGDRVAGQPWRMAVSVLCALGRGHEAEARFPGRPDVAGVVRLASRRGAAPLSSSLGRLFEAAAALLGVCSLQSFEGQAAMALEALASRYGPVSPEGPTHTLETTGSLDLRPLFDRLADETDPARGAALFHAGLIRALGAWCRAVCGSGATVALGGGCFINRILGDGLARTLERAGLFPLRARRLPPNDGGLSFGQAIVARRHLQQEDP